MGSRRVRVHHGRIEPQLLVSVPCPRQPGTTLDHAGFAAKTAERADNHPRPSAGLGRFGRGRSRRLVRCRATDPPETCARQSVGRAQQPLHSRRSGRVGGLLHSGAFVAASTGNRNNPSGSCYRPRAQSGCAGHRGIPHRHIQTGWTTPSRLLHRNPRDVRTRAIPGIGLAPIRSDTRTPRLRMKGDLTAPGSCCSWGSGTTNTSDRVVIKAETRQEDIA